MTKKLKKRKEENYTIFLEISKALLCEISPCNYSPYNYIVNNIKYKWKRIVFIYLYYYNDNNSKRKFKRI
jgi:hypothetical protein